MLEPPVGNTEELTEDWLAWLRSHSTNELNQLADTWGKWRPADNPGLNADLVMEKWEAACSELDARKESGS